MFSKKDNKIECIKNYNNKINLYLNKLNNFIEDYNKNNDSIFLQNGLHQIWILIAESVELFCIKYNIDYGTVFNENYPNTLSIKNIDEHLNSKNLNKDIKRKFIEKLSNISPFFLNSSAFILLNSYEFKIFDVNKLKDLIDNNIESIKNFVEFCKNI